MTDLTKITTPFGLLDAETQKALREHGGPYENYTVNGEWQPVSNIRWRKDSVYRVKPAPPKPREWWLHPEKRQAISYSPNDRHDTAWIHVREVLG